LRALAFRRTSKGSVSGGLGGMNDQWGRSGSGRPASGGGIGGMLFACVVSLALGAAGGYGAFRMMDGAVPTGEIEERDQRIADLAKELDARVAQVEENTQKAQAASEENAGLKRQLEALRKNAGSSDSAAALAENARLTETVMPELKNELELAKQLVADAEALKKRAEEAVRDRDRQLSLRADEIARLEKALTDVRNQQSSSMQNAEKERQEAEAALRRELEEAQRAQDTIRTTDLPALREEIARKDKEIAELKARNTALAARINTLESAARAATVRGEPEGGGNKPVIDNQKSGQKPGQARDPRSAVLVALAIDNTPGLDRLSSAQREQLERTLVSGECVTKALNSALRRVPVLALRNLMRDLDSDC
jgi:cell division protein FtsB